MPAYPGKHSPRGRRRRLSAPLSLDLLGVPHKIGSTVTLTYSCFGETDYRRFPAQRFLGRGDPLPMAQMVWVSRDYCLAHMKTATEESIAMGDFEGDYNLSLWFTNIFKLKPV